MYQQGRDPEVWIGQRVFLDDVRYLCATQREPNNCALAQKPIGYRRCANHNRKSAKLISTIDLSGFASVMLALVAMFLLPAAVVIDSPTGARNVAVDLAKVSNSTDMRGARREDALLVAVQRDGHIWFDRDQITSENLAAAIRERVSHGAEPKVYIRADLRAKDGRVVEVLSSVRSAGIENVGFLVNERNALPAR